MMNNKHSFRFFRLPFVLIKQLHQKIMEKLEFSIQFKLSFTYLRIFLKYMILAGLGVFFLFSGIKMYQILTRENTALDSFLESAIPRINEGTDSFNPKTQRDATGIQMEYTADSEHGAYRAYTAYSRHLKYLTYLEQAKDDPSLTALLREYSNNHNLPISIYNPEKALLMTTDFAWNHLKCPLLFSIMTPKGSQSYLVINYSRVLALNYGLNLLKTLDLINGGKVIFAPLPANLVFLTPASSELRDIITLMKILLVIFSLVIFFALISIFWAGRGFFLPIKEMTHTVKDISAKNLNLRLNVGGAKDELKELALTFNEMMNRIEDNYNRQKQFVSDASHELRTPIAVIQGYANLLNRWGKDDPAVLEESIMAIKNESTNMQELIEKLLFLARHDKDNFVLQKEDFNLIEILQEISRETHLLDQSHQINFYVHTGAFSDSNSSRERTELVELKDFKGDLQIHGDKQRIKQALRIFVDNAIKYTPPEGEITITLSQERIYQTDDPNYGDDQPHSSFKNYRVIKIRDTGIGMTREELSYVFDRFYRSEQSRSKENSGHGLGLAIAKIIILNHQGKIKVRSKKDSGSEFSIYL